MTTEEMLFNLFKSPTLTTEQIAQLLKVDKRTIINAISAGRFGIPTYREGRQRLADVRDVAAYLDGRREAAHKEKEKLDRLLN